MSLFRRELGRVCQHGVTHHNCNHSADLNADVAASLAQICHALSRLYNRHSQMQLVCRLLHTVILMECAAPTAVLAFLPEHDYVTLGVAILSVCKIGAPYSGG